MKVKIIRNPKSLDDAVDEAVKKVCREGSATMSAEAHWQPCLFPDEGPDAVVYVSVERGK
jgi:hypothetical protein